MIQKDKYTLMFSSSVTDSLGNPYPDLTSFPVNEFVIKTRAVNRQLSYNDCLRFFDTTYTVYDSFNAYDDIILWLNDIEQVTDVDENFEKNIKFYTKTDIDSWYLANIKQRA